MSDKTRISTNVKKDLLKIFKEKAEKEGRHLNYYIEKGLELLLKSEEERTETKIE